MCSVVIYLKGLNIWLFIIFLDVEHPSGYDVEPNCNFDLHFPSY
jgi:hypothetical protein